MTYETVDNFLTLTINTFLCGTGLWLITAFAIFVATHDITSSSDHLSNSESAQSAVSQEEPPQQQLQTTITAEPEAAPPIQPKISEQFSDDQVAILHTPTIVAIPIDFSRLTAAQLRCPHLRKSYGISLRPKGQSRAFNKAELVALYLQAVDANASKERAA